MLFVFLFLYRLWVGSSAGDAQSNKRGCVCVCVWAAATYKRFMAAQILQVSTESNYFTAQLDWKYKAKSVGGDVSPFLSIQASQWDTNLCSSAGGSRWRGTTSGCCTHASSWVRSWKPRSRVQVSVVIISCVCVHPTRYERPPCRWRSRPQQRRGDPKDALTDVARTKPQGRKKDRRKTAAVQIILRSSCKNSEQMTGLMEDNSFFWQLSYVPLKVLVLLIMHIHTWICSISNL